jgi:radical SAM superfamily enzyme YgiQ (UPF0313 family)
METLRVLLVEPGSCFAEEGCETMMKQTPSLGLVSIATSLNTHPQIEAFVYDQQIHGVNGLIPVNSEPDILGIQCYSYNIDSAYNVAREMKKIFPNMKIFLGGPFPSSLPKRAFDDCFEIDGIVMGEGELSLLEYCQSLLNEGKKEIEGVYLRGEKREYKSRYDADLEELYIPDWKIVNYDMYAHAYSYKYKEMKRLFPISTSRGCSFYRSCSFCFGNFLGEKIRFRSPQNVFDEINYNYHEHGAEYFYFLDPNFLFNKDRVHELCDLLLENMIDKKINLSWKCQSRASFADLELFKKMKKAGCELIFFGFESANDEVLRYNKGNQTKEMIQKAVRYAKEAGIKVRASFILGLPFDTLQSMEETVQTAYSLCMDGFAIHTLDLYPETKIWKEIHSEWGSLKTEERDFEYSIPSRGKPIITVNNATPKDMQNLKRIAEESQVNKYNAESIMERNFIELEYYRKFSPKVFRYILPRKTKEISWSSHLYQS